MSKISYTPAFLSKLEDILSQAGFTLRYEKGHFKSGYCLLKSHHVVVVNKFLTIEGRIHTLLELLRELKIERSLLSEKTRTFYDKLMADSSQSTLELT